MFRVQFGVKLNHWESGNMYELKTDHKDIESAKTEVFKVVNDTIGDMFDNISYGKIYMIPEDYSASYDGFKTFLIGRLDGVINDEDNEGEFCVQIIEHKE